MTTPLLIQASNHAHIAILSPISNVRPFSAYPVMETEFWDHLYVSAKNPLTAPEVLKSMQLIEQEPCIDNLRIYGCVVTAKTLANQTINVVKPGTYLN